MMRFGPALVLAVICPATGFAQVEPPSNDELRQQDDAPAYPSDTEQPAPAEPVLRVQFEEVEAIPGQPLDLRLTVLVPTFMPDPPVWPSLEAPNLLVRLPEGSTTPVSDRLGGETWSGVSRRYRLSPMVPGDFAIPPQAVVVTYADPETNAPKQATVSTPAISFAGVLPHGGEGLDPFLAAQKVELTQEVEGDPSAMMPGDSFTRTVTARITGTSPMFLPNLLPATTIGGLAAYPDEPVVEETDDHGSRIESITYVAEGGGSGGLPGLSLDWYSLESGAVETATTDGLAVSVDAPPARASPARDWRSVGIAAVLSLLLLAMLVWLVRHAVPPIRRWLARRREAHLASEAHAFAVLRRVVAARDLPRLYPALDDWAQKLEGRDPRRQLDLLHALTDLGAARYGRTPGSDAHAWNQLASALPKARRRSVRLRETSGDLPPMNPGSLRVASRIGMEP